MYTNMNNDLGFDQSDSSALLFPIMTPEDVSAPYNCPLSPIDMGLSDHSETPFTSFLCGETTSSFINSRLTEMDPLNINTILYSDELAFCPPSINEDDVIYHPLTNNNYTQNQPTHQITMPILNGMNNNNNNNNNNINSQNVQNNNDRRISFEEAYNDESCIFLNPRALHFLPEKYWSNQPQNILFSQLVNGYFKQNRTQNSTFMLKLYNLLLISIHIPQLEKAIGVRWINDTIIEISRSGLINMFNVRDNTVDGSMFHRQGNFPTHQFVEINDSNFMKYQFYEYPQMERVVGDTKFFVHDPNVFTRRQMTESELRSIKYSNEAKKTYRSKFEMPEPIFQ